eukprot:CAMPEP_0182434856 /NCGR_PEP_ID=MMETSP1167-20130531/72205_1 /TAXON_ID=2988 /ORGANISM="Mallomonas Sp, Strain CCMP3275" /LENGTH=43 /DNA_ID= /DNA_START= /DNA_END= /DNA_ORIENTATION=
MTKNPEAYQVIDDIITGDFTSINFVRRRAASVITDVCVTIPFA